MKKNPFSEIITVMREEGSKNNPPALRLAEVTLDDPLKIKIDDIEIDKDNLLVADYLLDNYIRDFEINETKEVTGLTDAKSIADHGSHNHNLTSINLSGKINFIDKLKKGDTLAVIPLFNQQTFIILARVVKL